MYLLSKCRNFLDAHVFRSLSPPAGGALPLAPTRCETPKNAHFSKIPLLLRVVNTNEYLPYTGRYSNSGIFPFGLDVAPCLVGLVAGGSSSQNSLRTLDTIFSCDLIVSSSYLACKSLDLSQ